MATMQTMSSPLGVLRLYAHAEELTGVYLPDQPAPDAIEARARVLDETAAQLRAYFAGDLSAFDLPLAPTGTPFQRMVWSALEAIPFAVTRTYGELARAIGRPSASRAVGTANSKNPISIIVPCHRVIGANGELTGYAGGMAAKRWLLDHETRHSISRSSPQVPSSAAMR
jgi:methylated-DNA-[protein]-cysteine S-methyltransferase